MFDKVKVVLIGALVAGLAGLAGYAADVEWAQFGPFGPAIGLAVGAALAYFRREATGYGIGVPVLEDVIPGGKPLPTGAE